jgi:hypothetical protein
MRTTALSLQCGVDSFVMIEFGLNFGALAYLVSANDGGADRSIQMKGAR